MTYMLIVCVMNDLDGQYGQNLISRVSGVTTDSAAAQSDYVNINININNKM